MSTYRANDTKNKLKMKKTHIIVNEKKTSISNANNLRDQQRLKQNNFSFERPDVQTAMALTNNYINTDNRNINNIAVFITLKNYAPRCLTITSAKGPFFKILSPITSQRFQSHLQYVATLPCDSRKFKKCY